MFTFNKDLKLTSVGQDFINAHSLPSIEALQNTSVITLIAFIVSPETEADHTIIWETHAKLLALRLSEEITYNLPIANHLYEVSFKALSNEERLGRLRRLEKPQMSSRENENVGGVLTSLILASGSAIQECTSTPIANEPNSIDEGKRSSIPFEMERDSLPRILVVDDSDVNREVADIFLAPDFPQPIYAKNGLEALDILRREQLDLILMDIHMPDMNGVEATLAIREADAPWSNIVIIALTADTAYQHSRVYRNIGMDDAISKPIRQDVLIKTILTNWNAAKLTEEARSAKLEYAS